MVEDALGNITLNLLSSGIAAGTGITAREAASIIRRDQISKDLGEVATEFNKALKEAIDEENDRLNSNELASFTDKWTLIAEELATTPATSDATVRRDAEELDVLFTNEDDAVRRISETYADVEGFNLDNTPQLREAMEDALTRAYRKAVSAFEKRIAGTDLADRFEAETNLVLAERLANLQDRLGSMEADLTRVLTKEAYNEGFRQLSPSYFARQSPSHDACWRVGFSLVDVEAGIPADRRGIDSDTASSELLDQLCEDGNRMVVGRPGSGKSTLCKQVAVRWHKADDLGGVLYRETGSGKRFESTYDLIQAIERLEKPGLIVVEDAVREEANRIAEVVEECDAVEDVRFLFDARREEIDELKSTGSLDVSVARRQGTVLNTITRYPIPLLSVGDVEQVCEAFADATGRSVHREPSSLHEQLHPDDNLGIGEMLLLTFFLPATTEKEGANGLEDHVTARYETLENPDGGEALRDLTEFNADLLADVGVMVTLLTASGIGIYQELVHALAYEYGHDIDTHDEIESILERLEGWFLFPTADEGPFWTTHELWSTLYLRKRALDHAEQQASSRRRDRSEPRAGRCLEALFRVFDDEDHRKSLAREFPRSNELENITEHPEETASQYANLIFDLAVEWPVLAPLYGTSKTATYELPSATSYNSTTRMIMQRGCAHANRGAYLKARSEFERQFEKSREREDRRGEATGLNNLGEVERALGEYDQARDYYQQSLSIFRDLGNRRGEAACLNNLGLIADLLGERDDALEYHKLSLDIYEEINDVRGRADNLNNLGTVVHSAYQYEDSLDYFYQSHKLFQDIGDLQRESTCLNNLGEVTRELGEYKQAWEYHCQSLKIRRDLGDRQGEAISLTNLGIVAWSLGEYERSRENFELAKDLFEKVESDRYELMVRCNLIKLELKTNQIKQARNRCTAAHERLGELDGNFSDERNQLESICESIPEN